MDYKKILDDIIDYDDSLTIISGYGDFSINSDGIVEIKNFKDTYWKIIGRATDEMIQESLLDVGFDINRYGEYQFWVVFKYYSGYSGDEDDSPGYLNVVYSRFEFIQSFEARDRQTKLDELLPELFL